jgi:hypothetical protein
MKFFLLPRNFDKYFLARYAIISQSLYFTATGNIHWANSTQSHCAQAFYRKKPLCTAGGERQLQQRLVLKNA